MLKILAWMLPLSVVLGNEASVEDFVKVRCALDGSDVIFSWSGSIFSYEPQVCKITNSKLHNSDFLKLLR